MTLPKVDVKKILYATDLSENARYAFAYAISLADLYRAGLTILHVIPEDPDLDDKVIGYVSSAQWEQIKQNQMQDARDALIGKRRDHIAIRAVLDQFRKDVENDFEELSFQTDKVMVERGHPAEQIVRVAEEETCDLIVMGRHGYGALKDTIMGGTARGVLRGSQKPVLLVRLPDEEA